MDTTYDLWDTVSRKFWAQVEVTGSCWLWLGRRDRDGYGYGPGCRGFSRAHRASYSYLVGPIPEGMQLDHLCRVKHCVNPDHLEPVTVQENNARRKKYNIKADPNRAKITPDLQRQLDGLCRKGHVLAEVGVLKSLRSNGSVRQQCRACQHDVQERYRRNRGIESRGRRKPYGPRTSSVRTDTPDLPTIGRLMAEAAKSAQQANPQVLTPEMLSG